MKWLSLKNLSKTPIAFLEELGYLSEPFILAHCILATDEDLASLVLLMEKRVSLIVSVRILNQPKA